MVSSMSALPVVDAHSQAPRASRGLYTYGVKPVGPVITISSDHAPDELTMTANLVRLDGTSRRHALRVRNTERQPDLVALVRERLASGKPLRMVFRFENVVSAEGSTAHMRVQAIADTLLDLPRQVGAVQLDLFG